MHVHLCLSNTCTKYSYSVRPFSNCIYHRALSSPKRSELDSVYFTIEDQWYVRLVDISVTFTALKSLVVPRSRQNITKDVVWWHCEAVWDHGSCCLCWKSTWRTNHVYWWGANSNEKSWSVASDQYKRPLADCPGGVIAETGKVPVKADVTQLKRDKNKIGDFSWFE